MQIQGQCHCGNINYSFHWPGENTEIPVRACSCTFCLKHGGVYASHSQATLTATIHDKNLLTKYRFGTNTADFYICQQCGVVPFVSSEIQGQLYAVVNVNTFTDTDPSIFSHAITDFEGENTTSRLDRRQRNWIPSVNIS